MPKESGSLSKAYQEMIVIAISAKSNYLYCVVAHRVLLRIYAKNPLTVDQVAVNHHKADIALRQKTMLNYAIKICLDSQSITNFDHVALRMHGFDDKDIWDIAAITAFFGFWNRMTNMTSMRLNSEFYLIGRLSRVNQMYAVFSNPENFSAFIFL